MSYRVELETRARKEFLKLPREQAEVVALVFNDLQVDARPPGAKKLAGVDGYRIRKGDLRILYAVDDSRKLVRIFRVGQRQDVYRRL